MTIRSTSRYLLVVVHCYIRLRLLGDTSAPLHLMHVNFELGWKSLCQAQHASLIQCTPEAPSLAIKVRTTAVYSCRGVARSWRRFRAARTWAGCAVQKTGRGGQRDS